jgi:PAS domain S-box-containing protein
VVARELFDEGEGQRLINDGINYQYMFYLYTARAFLSFLFRQTTMAVGASVTAEACKESAKNYLIYPVHLFIYSLGLLSAELDASELPARLEKVADNLELMRLWASLVPLNFQHQLELVEAEQARCLGRISEAAENYERSINHARRNGYSHESALAAELAAEFYLSQQDYPKAVDHLVTAYYSYQAWGAKAKLRDLENRYPQWLPPGGEGEKQVSLIVKKGGHPTDEITSSIDLNTILKASLELTQQTSLDELLHRLISFLIENTGAQNGSLILWREDGWYLEVQRTSEPEQKGDLLSLPLNNQGVHEDNLLIPVSLVNYVINSQVDLVLDDASTSNQFSLDPYIQNRQPKSILCAPLLNQGVLRGVVYLENNLITAAFASDRLEIVHIISGQAAASIEKARLYEQLETLVDKRTRELTKTNKKLVDEIDVRTTTEEALRLSEARYRAVFETTGTAMALLDEKGEILLTNGEFVRLTGYSKEELENHFNSLNVVSPADVSRILQLRKDRFADPSRVPKSFEFKLVDRTGQEKAVINTATILPGSNSTVISLIDISQRKYAEEAVRYNEAVLRKVLEILPVGVWIVDKTPKIVSGNPESLRIWAGAKYVEMQKYGEYLAWRVDTGERIKAEDWAGGLAVTEGKVTLNEELEIAAFDGTRRFILNSAMPLIVDEDGLIGAIVVNQDITRRKQDEEELQKAHDQLSTLLQISQSIVSTLDLDRLLNLIIEQLGKVMPYHAAAILILEQNFLRFQVIRGPSDFQRLLKYQFSVREQAVIAPFINGKEAFYFPDILDQKDLMEYIREKLNIPFEQIELLRSWLILPLIVKDDLIGALVLAHSQPDNYPLQSRTISQAYANQVAIAIQNAQLYKQAGDIAALEERNRLARELHDSVAQALYSISLFTDATRLALETNKLDVVSNHLADLVELSREAMADMRLMIFELRPPIIEREGLAAALQSRLDSVEARAGFQAIFKSEGEVNLSPDEEGELYRIAQEALNNVIKHAHAKLVKVQLDGGDGFVQLTIEDDGIGFEPDTAAQGGGQGIRSIQERAEKLAATCQIQSAPNQGTKITVEVKQ